MSYARLARIADELADLETARYRLGQGRYQAVIEAIEAIKPVFANTPYGVMGLTPVLLAAPDASYLVIDLAAGEGNSFHYGQVTLTTVAMAEIDGDICALNPANAELLGEMNLVATTPYHARPNDWADLDHPLRRTAYEGLVYASPVRGCSLLQTRYALPLSGPALRHPAFQRMADFAKAILAGDVPQIEVLKGFDAAVRTVNEPLGALEQEVTAILSAASKRYNPLAWDAGLVELIQRHDWFWHDSDEFAHRFAEDQQTIMDRLAALPGDVAMAFLAHAGAYAWRSAVRTFSETPEPLLMAA